MQLSSEGRVRVHDACGRRQVAMFGEVSASSSGTTRQSGTLRQTGTLCSSAGVRGLALGVEVEGLIDC